jgi:phospholipid/cholesterol/gamma-HCH transport system permease protein
MNRLKVEFAPVFQIWNVWALQFLKILSLKVEDFGKLLLFSFEVLRKVGKRPFRRAEIFKQFEFIGNHSFGVIMLTGFFVGLVFGLQVGGIFKIFKTEAMMGGATGKALARELAPLMTGFLLAGRAGSSITAEISSMKVNEQIDAIECMGVDPVQYLVVPRAIAGVIMTPLLCGLFNLIGMVGASLVGVYMYDVDLGLYQEKLIWLVQSKDIIAGLQKSVVFGFILTVVSCYKGLNASGGAKGVGVATTDSVVLSLLMILGCDVLITFFQVVSK